MDRDDDEEIIKSLLEPMEVDEIMLSGLLAFTCKDGHRVQIVGWAEVPGTITPEADLPADRILTLRAIIPAETYREFIRREAERLSEH